MTVETATYIGSLNPAYPEGGSFASQLDDHLRLVKSALKATFPNLTGPVTATQGVLNQPIPTGLIAMWSGSLATIPAGWLLCDGTLATPNLSDRFVVSQGPLRALGTTGGASTAALTAANLPQHTHGFTGTGSTATAGAHNHSVTDPGHTHQGNLPVSFSSATGATLSVDGNNNPSTMTLTSATGSAVTGITLIAAGDHAHTLSVSGTTDGSSGTASPVSVVPPYYALAFIMKS